MKIPKYKIGETIYHRTPNSDAGIITNIIYYYATDTITYQISVGFNGEFYCKEWEITKDKTF